MIMNGAGMCWVSLDRASLAVSSNIPYAPASHSRSPWNSRRDIHISLFPMSPPGFWAAWERSWTGCRGVSGDVGQSRDNILHGSVTLSLSPGSLKPEGKHWEKSYLNVSLKSVPIILLRHCLQIRNQVWVQHRSENQFSNLEFWDL